MLVRMWRKNTPPLLVGLQTGTITLEISLAVPQKNVTDLPEDPGKPLLRIYPKLLNYIHSSFSYDSQKMGTREVEKKKKKDI